MQVSARVIVYRTVLVAATLSLFLGGAFAVFGRSLFLPGSFANRTAESLRDDGVARFVADRITTEIVAQKPDLVGARPLILATVTEMLGSRPFRAVARTTAWRAHQTLFSEGGRQLVLSIPDLDVLVRSALAQAAPDLAEKIPEGLTAKLADLSASPRLEVVVDLWRLGRKVRWIARAAMVLSLLLLALAFWIAPARQKALAHCSVAIGVAGFLLLLVLPANRLAAALLIQDPLVRGAVDGVLRTYFAGLRIWGTFLVGVGVLFAAAGSALVQTLDFTEMGLRMAQRVARAPASHGARAGHGMALLASGVLLILFPRPILTAATILVGTLVAVAGLRELFRLVLGPKPGTAVARGKTWFPSWRAATMLALAAVAAAVWAFVRNPTVTAVPTTIRACNGHPELCDRRVDRVVFAGAHNAMSNAQIADWMFPHHLKAIPAQLQDGVRALLLDVHRGFPGGERIKTDLEGEKITRERLEAALGPEGVEAATRVRDRLVGVEEDRPGLYLCHGFCELGAYSFAGTLRSLRDFLVWNPEEVLILVLEDYVTVEELARAFDDSGLREFVYTGAAPPWPTLRQLIQSGQRVIVFLESGHPGVPWLRPTLGNIQETPYTFHDPSEFSCAPNRGGTEGMLFQINHWIQTTPAPMPNNATVVNARDFLLARARRCAEERHHLPNILAVDFYSIGDLFAVVDTLNGIGGPAVP